MFPYFILSNGFTLRLCAIKRLIAVMRTLLIPYLFVVLTWQKYDIELLRNSAYKQNINEKKPL